jgi:F0F1-type ATP synthase delta subunit
MSKVPRYDIAAMIADKSLQSNTSGLAREVAAYLLVEGRSDELDSLLRDVMLARATRGVIDVKVVSKYDLTEQVRDDIRAQFRSLYPDAKRIELNEYQDDTVIGSIRVELADKQLDLSVQAKLNKFKSLVVSGKD